MSFARDLAELIKEGKVPVCDRVCSERGYHHKCYDSGCLNCNIYQESVQDRKNPCLTRLQS